MSLDFYSTDDDREKFIKKMENDEFLLYSIREKSREYVDYCITYTTNLRKDLHSVDSAEDAVRIHGDISGISKLLKAFSIGLDQSVMNEPTEIDLKDWANLSLFRVALIRRKFSSVQIFIEKTGSAEYLIKIETMLYCIHRFLTSGEWDDDEVQMLEEDTFHDTSFLNSQGIIEEGPLVLVQPPKKKEEEKPKKEKKPREKKKKTRGDKAGEEKGEEEEENKDANDGEVKEVVETTKDEDEKKTTPSSDDNTSTTDVEVGKKDEEAASTTTKKKKKEAAESGESEDASGREGLSLSLNTPIDETKEKETEASKLEKKIKRPTKSPLLERRAIFTSDKRRSFSNLFKGKVSSAPPAESQNLSTKVSHLRESVSMLEYKSKKFTWSPKWFILNPENIEIYKDDKSVSLSKAISLSIITKIEEVKDDFELMTPSTFGLGKRTYKVPKDILEPNDDPNTPKTFIVEYGTSKSSLQNICLKVKNFLTLSKWITTIDGLISLSRPPIIDIAVKLNYLSAGESHTNTGTIQNDQHTWKYDGKRFKLRNREANMNFSWNGSQLKQRGGENIGTMDWDGVNLRWEKSSPHIRFTWIDADKEFQVLSDSEVKNSWNYNGESFYRKDDKNINWIVKNRPPIPIIIAVNLISSFLSNTPLWEVEGLKSPRTAEETNQRLQRKKNKIMTSNSSRVRLMRKFQNSESKKQENNNNAPNTPEKDEKEKPLQEEGQAAAEGEGKNESKSPRQARSPRLNRSPRKKEENENTIEPRNENEEKEQEKEVSFSEEKVEEQQANGVDDSENKKKKKSEKKDATSPSSERRKKVNNNDKEHSSPSETVEVEEVKSEQPPEGDKTKQSGDTEEKKKRKRSTSKKGTK